MHELSLCQDLLEQVDALVKQHQAQTVKRIELHVGVLSGVEATLLSTAFAELCPGSVAASAQLEMLCLPAQVFCAACQLRNTVPANDLRCPVCRREDTRLVQGDELLLAQVELLG
ncbi:MAG: hydrogenase maturation nickel metallochaperone HypA [Methylococcales bacterium]|nr:hydrogenase maturation nickel metallochaperone HypA [Methylococcales bacterium]